MCLNGTGALPSSCHALFLYLTMWPGIYNLVVQYPDNWTHLLPFRALFDPDLCMATALKILYFFSTSQDVQLNICLSVPDYCHCTPVIELWLSVENWSKSACDSRNWAEWEAYQIMCNKILSFICR